MAQRVNVSQNLTDSNFKVSSPHTSHITHHHPLAYALFNTILLGWATGSGAHMAPPKNDKRFLGGASPFRLHRSSLSIQKLYVAAAGSSLHRSELEETRLNYKEHAISAISKYIKMIKIFMYLWYQRRGREARGERVRW